MIIIRTENIKLQDNRILGTSIFEIESIPNYSVLDNELKTAQLANNNLFLHIANEVYKLCEPNNVAIEFLWATEKAENQIYNAQIRLFCIVRIISNSEFACEQTIQIVCETIVSRLTAQSFVINEPNDLDSVLLNIKHNQINALVKTERVDVNFGATFPYYCCDILDKTNSDFESVINTLSRYEGVAVSFQIIPTNFSAEETSAINYMTTMLNRVVTGFAVSPNNFYKDPMAKDTLDFFGYYNKSIGHPLFHYNILIFGENNACCDISAKLSSMLQYDEEGLSKTQINVLNLNAENLLLSRDFNYYPWNINYQITYAYRNQELWKQLQGYEQLFRLPYVMTLQEVNSFFKLPIDDGKTLGIKVNCGQITTEQFSNSVINGENIQFGKLKSTRNETIEIGCPEKAFTKHALIVGMPGSGKTTFSVNLLLQFHKKGIPFLAIEPTKTEYRALIDVIDNLQIFTPGKNDVSPFIINPFIPPKGITVEQFIPNLASAFKAAFSMPSPLDILFLKAIRVCYSEYGWKDYSKAEDIDVVHFGLYEFIKIFKKLIKSMDYSKDVRSNIETGGVLRLLNLIEQNSNIYDTVNTIPIEDLITRPTILELNAIDNAEQKSLIMALLLINTCLYTKHHHIGDGNLKNIMLIDEAHVLLAGASSNTNENGNPQAATVKAIQDMIVEIRSYGTGIIIADQAPSKVSREVVANTDIKIAFRLVEATEKEIIVNSTNMTEFQKSQLPQLSTGEAYVYYNALTTPQFVKVDDLRNINGIRLSVPNSEVAERVTYWKAKKSLLMPFRECKYSSLCKNTCDFKLRSEADYFANKFLNDYATNINDKEKLYKYTAMLHKPLEEYAKSYEKNSKFVLLSNCCKIRFLRKFVIDKSILLSNKEYEQILKNVII